MGIRGFVQVGMCVVCTLVVEAEPEPDRWSLGVGEAQVANAVPLQNISFFFLVVFRTLLLLGRKDLTVVRLAG